MTQIFLIADGINNSVFYSQVLTPFLNKAKEKKESYFLIVSFEKNPIEVSFDLPENLEIITFKKGWTSQNIKNFNSVLENHKRHKVIARGPVAGLIAINSSAKNITVQARGLAAEEYELANKTHNPLKWIFNKLRKNYYLKTEQTVYSNPEIKIEVVSEALREYLIANFNSKIENIFLAKNDQPKLIPATKISSWKKEIRKQLDIPMGQYVYVYSGSAKPWQEPKDIAKYLVGLENNSFFIILTSSKKEFKTALEQVRLAPRRYKILTTKESEIFKYLAAADAGIIYRNPHIVNWVARPTKALEYEAAGLKIIHNKTVDFLNKNY